MKGLIRGAAGLAVVLGMSACAKDETVDLMGPPTGVQATPASIILADGDSTSVVVRLVNDRNQATPTSFTISNVSPTLVVKYDAAFRPDYSTGDTLVPPVDKTEQRYFVLGVGLGVGQFDITSSGITKTVKVTVMPGKLKNIATVLTPALGDTITVTAPAGTRFTAATRFVSPRGTADSAAIIVAGSFSADSTTVKIIPQASINGPLTVTNLVLLYNPAIPVNRSYPTAQSFLTTPLPANLGPAALNTTAPTLGAPVTVTAPTGWIFLPSAVVSVENGPNTPAPVIVSRSADSTSITFIPIPGTVTYSGRVFVTNMVARRLPFAVYGRQVGTTQQLTVLPVSVAPTTASTLTPLFGSPVTLTLGANLRFTSTSTVSVGGRAAVILSRSADSSQAVIVPLGAFSGLISYTNIVLSNLNAVPLSPPGDKSLALGAITSMAGANVLATAPDFIALPATGVISVFSDGGGYIAGAGGKCNLAGGDGCRYYKIVSAVSRTVDFDLFWDPNTTTDLGLYLLNAGQTAVATFADAAGNQAGGHETGANRVIPAGTTWLMVVYYASGGEPPFFQIKMTGK